MKKPCLLTFMMNAEIDTDAIERRVLSLQSPQLKQSAMTYAQKLRQEGRQEGQLQTLRHSVLEVLEVRFGELPVGLREEIMALAEEERLRNLHRSAIRCTDLEAFAAEL